MSYIIKYTNYIKIGSRTFAFRKKLLFDITGTPMYLPIQENNKEKGHWINKTWYPLEKLDQMAIKEPIEKDVSDLQWNIQCELDECFNLEKNN